MSILNPSEPVRGIVKFYSELLQALAIIVAGLWAAFTYHNQSIEQAANARNQSAAVERELRRPYNEKKLTLYLDAARVAAHLTASPNSSDRAQTETRFWELYWGELAFVESTGDKSSIETLMVAVCERVFSKDRCHQNMDTPIGTAMLLSHGASSEIQQTWKGEYRIPIDELMAIQNLKK